MIYSGLGKASLVVCVSQAPYLFDESIHVLKFASIATRVTAVEQFREPPRPAATPSSRFSTVLAAGGDGGKSLPMASSGRSSMAWEEEPRSLPPFAGGGRSLPAAFGARMRSTGGGSIPPRVEEGQEEDEQVGQNTVLVRGCVSLMIIFFFVVGTGTCFTVAPVRHKICVLYVEKIHTVRYLDLKKRQLSCSDSLFLPH
jgi:hypothetical protein